MLSQFKKLSVEDSARKKPKPGTSCSGQSGSSKSYRQHKSTSRDHEPLQVTDGALPKATNSSDVNFSGKLNESKMPSTTRSASDASNQNHARVSSTLGLAKSQCINPSQELASRQTSLPGECPAAISQKLQGIDRNASETAKSFRSLKETPTRSHGLMHGKTKPSPDGLLRSSSPSSVPQAARTVAHKAPSLLSHKQRSAAVTQAASKEELPDTGSSTMATFGTGNPFQGKGKGKAPESNDSDKNSKSFPPAWGFGRSKREAPEAVVSMMTLLELLSCRKHELFTPHVSHTTNTLNHSSVTRSRVYSYEDVMGKCESWPDFNFQNMVQNFAFLNKQVPVPQELGMLCIGSQSMLG